MRQPRFDYRERIGVNDHHLSDCQGHHHAQREVSAGQDAWAAGRLDDARHRQGERSAADRHQGNPASRHSSGHPHARVRGSHLRADRCAHRLRGRERTGDASGGHLLLHAARHAHGRGESRHGGRSPDRQLQPAGGRADHHNPRARLAGRYIKVGNARCSGRISARRCSGSDLCS